MEDKTGGQWSHPDGVETVGDPDSWRERYGQGDRRERHSRPFFAGRSGVGHGQLFFFSSRRRHTRSYGDWSSDVCSSDLSTAPILLAMYLAVAEKQGADWKKISGTLQNDILKEYIAQKEYIFPPRPSMRLITDIFKFCAENEIGRASCRERWDGGCAASCR